MAIADDAAAWCEQHDAAMVMAILDGDESTMTVRSAAHVYVVPGSPARLIAIEPFEVHDANPMPVEHEWEGEVRTASSSGFSFDAMDGFMRIIVTSVDDPPSDDLERWRSSRSPAEISADREACRPR